MKYLKLKATVLLVAIVTIYSCSLGDDGGGETCIENRYAKITAVTGNDTIQVGRTATANVTFTIDNDCGYFYNFGESPGVPRQVGVLVQYEGCKCDTVVSTETKPYVFTPSTVGEFAIKFYVSPNTFITKTYTVVE
ncbi:MAG: hypothetical protein EOO45_09710 [Flavobacterium sp.]|nr:MAG: hypothetical protein EOO45_09710 [Flavobacterium sp.]